MNSAKRKLNKLAVMLMSIAVGLFIFLGIFGLTVKPARAEAIDTGFKCESISASVYGGETPQLTIGVTLPDEYKELLENGNLQEEGNDYISYTEYYLLVARAESPQEYYSLTLTGETDTPENTVTSKLNADVYVIHKTNNSTTTDNILTTFINGNVDFLTKNNFTYISAIFQNPEIEVNYYYWAYVVKINYLYEETTTPGVAGVPITGRFWGISSEQIAKSDVIVTDNGAEEILHAKASDLYKAYLENDNVNYDGASTKTNVRVFQKALGYYFEDQTNVTVKYKAFENGTFLEKEDNFLMDGLYLTSKKFAIRKVITNGMSKTFTDFNVVKTEKMRIEENGGTYDALTDARILLEVDSANPYTYEYFNDNTAVITLNYKPFSYKDLFLHVYHNDDENMPLYTLDIYPIDVSTAQNGSVIKLTYSQSYISQILLNKLEWLVEFNSADVNINNMPLFVSKTDITKTVDGVDVPDGFVLSFPAERESELYGMTMNWVAVIKEDTEFRFTYTYVSVNDDLTIEYHESTPETRKYSALTVRDADDFYDEFKDVVDGDNLKPTGFLTPIATYNGVSRSWGTKIDEATQEPYDYYTVNFLYKFTTVIKTSNNVTSEFDYFVFNGTSLDKKASDFNFKIPSGYRVTGYSDLSNAFVISNFNKQYPGETKIYLDAARLNDEITVYELRATLSDKWPISIDYLKQFKSQITGKGSCFATMETFTGEIRVADYDVYNLTAEDVDQIIYEATGESAQFIDFINIPIKIAENGVTVELKNTTEGDVYFVTLDYTTTYIKGIESDGSYDYFNVALTKFSDWESYFGKDTSAWNLTALAPDVFKYSDAVEHDKLYGFFSVMTFKEQVTNFDSWFKEYASGGAVTFFSQKEVKGDGFYKFLSENPRLGTVAGSVIGLLFGHPVKGAVAGTALQFALRSAGEWFNDANGTYYSYFFYLDGTNTKNYVAHNGADDYYDHESASSKKTTPILEMIVMILLVIGALILAGFLIKIISKIDVKPIQIILYVAVMIGLVVAVYFAWPTMSGIVTSIL